MRFVRQAFQDILQEKTWYDTYKCHDVHVLHWLVNLGYKCLMTDMEVPFKGSLLTYQGFASKGSHSLGGATSSFLHIPAGKKTLLEMCFWSLFDTMWSCSSLSGRSNT